MGQLGKILAQKVFDNKQKNHLSSHKKLHVTVLILKKPQVLVWTGSTLSFVAFSERNWSLSQAGPTTLKINVL